MGFPGAELPSVERGTGTEDESEDKLEGELPIVI
jgi:hypothetical protein